MDESNNKRKRTTTSNTNDNLHIIDLPDGLLVGISSYLAKPSVSLFALAMNSQSTETSKAILSAINWSVLDFSDIEKSLAAKLSDDDIDKILQSIYAVNNLQILKLAGCINIIGSGLNVLRSSTTIEQIDMSLVGMHEVPLIEPEPLLSKDIVIPILDNIISRGRESSLKHLELPKNWRKQSAHQEMDMHILQFLERYNEYLTNQRDVCSKCKESACNDNEWISLDREDGEGAYDRYGMQYYTCSLCVNHFCYGEVCSYDDDGRLSSGWCSKCEKHYCKSCSAVTECDQCYLCFCKCTDFKVCEEEGCGKSICEDCSKYNCRCQWL